MEPCKARIRGRVCYFPSKKALARHLMLEVVADKKAPFETRVMNLISVMEFLEIQFRKNWIGRKEDLTIKQFDQYYWNLLLFLEGMDTLPGFSVDCNIEKGDSNYNPENRRISTDWVLLEGE